MTAEASEAKAGASETLAWFGEMTAGEKRTFWACFAGWALDAMDVQLYSFVIPSLVTAWSISKADAGLLGAVALLMSAVGGWIAGLLCDKIGRVRTLQLTVAWFSVFTFLSGLCQNFEQLFFARTLMGLGFGGEWAAGAVLMGEVIQAKHRGKAVGSVQSGWAIGWGVAALSATVFFSILPSDLAWRALFLLGILPALLVWFIRRHVEEPKVFMQAKSAVKSDSGLSFLAIFSPKILRTTVLASLVATGMQGGYYAITTWLPTYLKTVRHLSILNSGGYLAVIILGSFIGYLVGAYLTDRIGRRRHLFVYSLCSMVTVLAYTILDIDDTTMLILGFPLGFFASGIFSGMGAFLTELFPTTIRGSGQGFCYNFGRGVGALFPWLVGALSSSVPLGQAIGLFAAGAYGVMFLAALLLPETQGRELVADHA